MLQLQLLAVFGKGIAMASWIWCDATLHAWGRYLRKKFHCEKEEPMKIQKHKIIARAFNNRKRFNEGVQISIFSQNHTDPVGLQFELNSAASNELSTTWAKNLGRLVNRRQAVPNDVGQYNSYNDSLDSDYSLNYRHVSIESRRNSGDSQVSVQIAELKATKRVKGRRTRRRDAHYSRSHSRNIGTSSRPRSRYGTKKRDSSTSLDSHLQALTALTNGNDSKHCAPNLDRRAAIAGLDGTHIEQLLSNGKLVLPPGIHTGSEDENVSVTISESTFNMRVANPNMDLNDQFTIQQLRQGLNIRQLSSSESSSCAEIKQLVQSSQNSNVSIGFEKNRGSRQSKNSTDVAVQANAYDLDLEMNNKKNEEEKLSKSKQMKTRENKRHRRASKYNGEVGKSAEKIRKSKEKYNGDGKENEKVRLCSDSIKTYSDCSDNERVIMDKNKVFIKKGKEIREKY